MPGMEKIQHMSLTTQVEKGLKDRLSIGALKPGIRLVTKTIALELGMSITPVREALLRLASSSALTIAPAQAFMVPDINMVHFAEIIRIRCELESIAVTEATGQMTAERMQNLKTLLVNYQQAQQSGSMAERLLANRAFRFRIYQYANMPILTEMIEQLWVRMGPSLHFLHDQGEIDGWQNSAAHYQRLLNEMETGNKDASRQCLLEIIDRNVAIIKRQYIN